MEFAESSYCVCIISNTQLTSHLDPVKIAGFDELKKELLASKKRKSPPKILFVRFILWRQSKLELDMVPSGLTQNLGW